MDQETSDSQSSNDAFAGLQHSVTTDPISHFIGNGDLQDDPKFSIKDDLNNKLQLDKRTKRERFLPSGDLNTICNYKAVRDELLDHQYSIHVAERLATYVCEKPAREIFAVLLLINQVKFLPHFYNAGIVDKDLPFGSNEQQTELWYGQLNEERPIEFWNHSRHAEMIREFYTKQWWVHVPHLGWDKGNRKALNFRYPQGTVIPWISIGPEIKKGGFGVVEKVEIHQDHYSFKQFHKFALKTIIKFNNDDDSIIFKKEIAAFRKMNPGPHLVELCATLEIIGGSSMLLFPWAEGGSLGDLMNEPRYKLLKDNDLTEEEFVRWIAIQCRGLIDALGTIHDTRINPTEIGQDGDQINQHSDFGIHKDIKPANILHFSQETAHFPLGNLKVADFGLITFHRQGSRSVINRISANAASQTYRSPEHDICCYMSKKIDIWALGCVFSELMTWVILNNGDALNEYRRNRFEELTHSGATANVGPWNEDNFFGKHIYRKIRAVQSASGGRWRKSRVKDDGSARRRVRFKSFSSRLRERIVSVSQSPEAFQEVPRLKVSVTRWIERLIEKSQQRAGSAFLKDFLHFIRLDMLNPQRKRRTDCKTAVEFLDNCMLQGSKIRHHR